MSLYIDGRNLRGRGEPITVINPATARVYETVDTASGDQVRQAVTAARTAFDTGPWPRMTPDERAKYLHDLADGFARRRDQFAALITAQVGSPVSFTAQTEHPEAIYRWYAGNHDIYPWNSPRLGGRLTVRREPVGVVAAITPWNMPQKTIAMKLAPALLAGCTMIIKPAPQTPLDALLLAEAAHEADLPRGVLNVIPTTNPVAGLLPTTPGIDKIAFTGSTLTGRHIAAAAAAHLRRVSLELGGKSPALALPDADPATVVTALRADTFTLSGQICSAHTRLLVPADRAQEYEQATAALAHSLRLGDPHDPATDLGPLITDNARGRVLDLIGQAIDAGARVLHGHPRHIHMDGWYVQPTVLTDLPPDHPAVQQEIFGPVLIIQPYHDIDQAIDLANGTRYGLEAAVWTGDQHAAAWIADRLRAGTVRINGTPAPLSSPLGGYRDSGIGRELGPEGIDGYTEVKALVR